MRVVRMMMWGAAALFACSDNKSGEAGETAVDSATADSAVEVAADSALPDSGVADSDNPKDSSPPETIEDTSPAPDTVAPPEDTTLPDSGAPDTAGDTSVAAPREVRFVVLGDTGSGNESQKQVAEQIRKKCEAAGCDFALLLGDNIYNAGVESTLDAQWQEKFEIPYENVDMPFYAALGNHDNGGFLTQWLGDTFGGAGGEFERGDFQVAYTQVSQKWRMPGRTYDFSAGPAHFFALDTNDMVWSYGNSGAEGRTQWQVDTIPGRIDEVTETWRIAFGHHPYLSNGKHGNAGAYEGLEEGITDLVANLPGLGDLSAVVTGDGVKESLDVIVCGRVDLYFAGHDHSRQWLGPSAACPGTTLVVSGAGSKTTELKGQNPALFQDVDSPGFFWVHLKDNTLEVEAIDEAGTLEWTHQATK